jgi:hypothetical protein
MRAWWAALFAITLLAAPSFAQTDETAPAPPSATLTAPTSVRIPAGTVVEVELTEALSSRTSQQEQAFRLRLAAPIVIDGREIVPAGAIGGGEVIDAHPSAFGGRQGRLIISGRYIEIGGQQARIRGMQITAAGAHRVNTALGVSMIPVAGVAAIFIQGGEVEIPAGARGTARLTNDIDVPISAAAAPAAEISQSLQGEDQQ